MTAARHTSQGSPPRKPRISSPPRGSSPPAPARARRMRSAGRSLVTRRTGLRCPRPWPRRASRSSVAGLPVRPLLVGRGHVHVRRGPRENQASGDRPAVPLGRGQRLEPVIGIVLEWQAERRHVGLHAIKRCGGIAVLQDRETRRFPTCRATPWPTSRRDRTGSWHLPAAREADVSRGSSSCSMAL